MLDARALSEARLQGIFLSATDAILTADEQQVIVQAGASDDGRQLAADTAEVVFTAHNVVETARVFYADVKLRMVEGGRDPDSLKILPGLSIYVAPTRAEAQAKLQELQDQIAACTTRGHRLHLKVGHGFVRRQGEVLAWYNPQVLLHTS